MSVARVLVVAGHDSSGRAGIDADREAARLSGVAVDCVVTAWTRQESERVLALDPVATSEWLAEARRTLAERTPRALKLGLLPGVAAVRAAVELTTEALELGLSVVVDPVLRATGGDGLLDEAAVSALANELLVLPVVATPNLPEAVRLADTDEQPTDRAGRLRLAERLLARGPRAVLLKGGHADEDPVGDLVLEGGEAEPHFLEHPRVPGPGLRGTGCRYATAVAAGLARGLDLLAAAGEAGALVFRRLRG